jgi:hypothetical protein
VFINKVLEGFDDDNNNIWIGRLTSERNGSLPMANKAIISSNQWPFSNAFSLQCGSPSQNQVRV